MRPLFLALPLGLALSACTTPPVAQSPGEIAPVAGACTAQAVDAFRGHALTGPMQESLRAAAGAGSVRVLQVNGMATTDYRPERLNIVVDAKGLIVSASCG